jgi:WXXGXW repeat (2 copies)
MKPKTKTLSVLGLAATSILFVACGGGKVVVVPGPATTPGPSALVATTPAPAVITTVPAMPQPPADSVQSVSPGPSYSWVAGYYDWRGDHYVWVPGTWVATPSTASVWISGRWQPTAGGYTWVPGHWQ